MGNLNKPPIPPEKRARILAKKMAHSDTQENIAKEEGVSRASVIRITPDSVSPQVLEMAEDYKEIIIEQAKRNVKDGLSEMYKRMYSDQARLSEVTGAVKISHDILRLETNQSTQNIAHGREKTPDEVCRAYVDGLIGQGATIEQALIALEAVPVLNGASVEDRARYAGGQRVAWKLGG